MFVGSLKATWGLQVEITFTHTGGATDWVYVLRDNGIPLRWPWPSFGTELPRDLMHFLVETRLGARHGFWGMVADGTNFGYLSFAVDQVRAGLPPSQPSSAPEVDLTELIQVECVIDALAEHGRTERTDAECLTQIRRACWTRVRPALRRRRWGSCAANSAS
jgi:hypothetical protein